ncbi:zinc ribbon domain-containing protein [Streptomyces sp. ODS28]|uniref:Zn-ribbon domain-containing OB-fold protein n=1 Tax=Streptomyces sp. ODS28 TaxID=3136688 RepID=UPI0031E8F00A
MSPTCTPVVAGWFKGEGEDFALLGTRCRDCAAVFFPREDAFCRNPRCAGTALEEVPLSRRGRVWSYTDGRYQPPHPYAWPEGREWEPYVLLAVELEAERMVVLGQAPPGTTVDEVEVGMEAELVPGVLSDPGGDADQLWTTWNWRPVAGAATGGGAA